MSHGTWVNASLAVDGIVISMCEGWMPKENVKSLILLERPTKHIWEVALLSGPIFYGSGGSTRSPCRYICLEVVVFEWKLTKCVVYSLWSGTHSWSCFFGCVLGHPDAGSLAGFAVPFWFKMFKIRSYNYPPSACSKVRSCVRNVMRYTKPMSWNHVKRWQWP